MQKSILFVLLILILMLFNSCKESEDVGVIINDSKYYTPTNSVSVLKNNALEFITNSVNSDSLIVFSGTTPNEVLPKVGSHVYIPVSEVTPNGMLVKVLSVNRGSTVDVKTEALPIEEAFEYLSLDKTSDRTIEIDGVYDEEGNPMDFGVVDTMEMSKGEGETETLSRGREISIRKALQFEDWKDACLKIPIKELEVKDGKDKISVNGTVYVGFDKFNLDIDVNKYKVNYIKLDATPYIKIAAENVLSTQSKVELFKRIALLRFKMTIPTAVGIPVIVPITFFIDLKSGIRGELSAKTGLQYKYNCNCVATYKNGEWTSNVKHGGFDNKLPWTVSEFDVNGEFWSGARLGLLAGLYSSTTGIGFNVEPKFTVATQAKLSSETLLKNNPNVALDCKIGSNVYCVAKIFFLNKTKKYTLEFPDYTLWSSSMSLLPNIENFTATGSSSSADISWSHNGLYFLKPMGVKTGTTIFKSDKTTVLKTYTPTPTSTNKFGYSTYNVNATGLNSGSTYYAAPFASWKDFKWYGDKQQLSTETSYKMVFRCKGQSYDVLNFVFTLNNHNKNTIDYTTEATDYSGSPMRIHVSATYDLSSNQLDGILDFYFYETPDQQRKDGFSISLSSDDSGYVDCSKIVDNGGCYSAIRVYKQSNKKAANKRYTKPLTNSDCNVGICNKY